MDMPTWVNLKYNFTEISKLIKSFVDKQTKERDLHTQDQKKPFISKLKKNTH